MTVNLLRIVLRYRTLNEPGHNLTSQSNEQVRSGEYKIAFEDQI